MRVFEASQTWRLGIACALAVGLFAFVGCKTEGEGGPNTGGTAANTSGGPSTTGNNSSGGNEIVIGEYASITGSEASFGKSSDEGTQLAADEINAAGGIDGKKVRVEVEDD